VRVVIVGAGGIWCQHAAACRALVGVDLVAVCDARPEAAAKLADMPPEDSIAQMRVIDAVYESLRTGQIAALRQGAPA
jgi:predicted homoserine dehydrogenase-like protein